MNLLALLLALTSFLSPLQNDWENEVVFERNKLAPRATSYSFLTVEDALTGARETSRMSSLNGEWQFHYSPTVEDSPRGFAAVDFSGGEGWKSIPVPSNWELQGFGQPLYTRFSSPLPPPTVNTEGSDEDADEGNSDSTPNPETKQARPPNTKRENSLGTYYRDFDVPEEWKDDSLILHFGGVSSAFYLFLNGRVIAYSQGSSLPAEFDITEHVKTGTNRLAVQVLRWCDGSYLEDHQMWQLSGIHREVLLLAQPKVALNDFFVETKFDDQLENARLFIHPELWNPEDAPQLEGLTLSAQLYNAEQKPLFSKEPTLSLADLSQKSRSQGDQSPPPLLEVEASSPRKWSAEDPYLYTLILSLKNTAGEVIEVRRQAVGFRTVAFSEKSELLINGKVTKLKGVSRRDHHPVTGKALTRAAMEADVKLMKRFNFNAVSTSNAPNDPYFLELCDQHGLYVMEEANVECHQLGRNLPGQPSWAAPILSRVIRMVERDKNHPAIISWSVGNGSASGSAFAAAAGWIRDFDPTRFVVNQSSLNNSKHPNHPDIISLSYPSLEEVVQTAENSLPGRSIVLSEYLQATGNSLGTLGEFWDEINDRPNLIGGFITDLLDEGLQKEQSDGSKYFAYSDDSSASSKEKPSSLNGVFSSDRRPNPHAWECKYVFKPAHFQLAELAQGTILATNRLSFTDLNRYELRWVLSQDGEDQQAGILGNFSVPPGETATLTIPLEKVPSDRSHDYWLFLSLHEKEARYWCQIGHQVAHEQILLSQRATPAPYLSSSEKSFAVTKSDESIKVSTGDHAITVSSANGQLLSLKHGSAEVLAAPMQPNFWRPPTNNDRQLSRKDPSKLEFWQNLLDTIETVSVAVSRNEKSFTEILVNQKIDNRLQLRTAYSLYSDGTLQTTVNLEADPSLPALVRFGMTMGISSNLTQTNYYGAGPWGNYGDRKRSAFVDSFTLSTDGLFHNYALPQDNGNHTATSILKLTAEDETGLIIRADPAFEFSLWPYSAQNISEALHPHDLVKQGFYTLNLDSAQTGLGGTRVGTLPRYELPAGDYQFSFFIQPAK